MIMGLKASRSETCEAKPRRWTSYKLSACAGLPWLLLLSSCQDWHSGTPLGNGASDGGQSVASMSASGSPATKLARRGEGGWINITGTIEAKYPNSFMLDYGSGSVRVEMDDWDWYREGEPLRPGDRVAVTGRVDHDLHTKKTIEARNVFVERLGTFFHASGADEESLRNRSLYQDRLSAHVEAFGRVIAVNGRELTLGPMTAPLTVDTSTMAENPLDREGFQQVGVGDRLYVWGYIDNDDGDGVNFKARGIVSYAGDAGKSA